MAISYNKALGGAGVLAVLALAGGTLLGLGMAGSHLGIWGGHTWQIATGSSMLGIGSIALLGTVIYMHQPRSLELARDWLQEDPRENIYTYAHDTNVLGGSSVEVLIKRKGHVKQMQYSQETKETGLDQTLKKKLQNTKRQMADRAVSDLTRVIVPLSMAKYEYGTIE